MNLSKEDCKKFASELKLEAPPVPNTLQEFYFSVHGAYAADHIMHEWYHNGARSTQAKQVGGNHYAKHVIQPWDIIDDWHLDYYLGNVIKYVLRDKHDQVEDLQKAIHYLEKKIQLLEDK